MKWVTIGRRWTARSIHSMILGAALAGPAGMVVAQAPVNSTASKAPLNYARSLSFHLPLKMDAEQRLRLKEVQLYWRTPTTGWKLQESGAPYLEQFVCTVPREGEYWYSLVTIDRSGQASVPDVMNAPPQMRVIVDTTPPVLQVQGCTGPSGEYCVRCTVDDANPDLTTLKATCKTDSGEIPLEAVPNQPGMFRVNKAEHMRYPVTVSVADLAKNVVSREVNVKEALASVIAAAPAPAPTTAPPANKTGSEHIALLSARPDPSVPFPPRPDNPPMLPKAQSLPNPETTKAEIPIPAVPVSPGLPSRVDLPTPPPLGTLTASSTGTTPEPTTASVNPIRSAEPRIKLPVPTEASGQGSVPYQLISTTLATVDYRIDHVGPSGVGKVEVYMTPDQGQTWHRLGDDPDKRSPAEIKLPGDGVFGVRIVITNGNGFGGHVPARGESPHCLIEVDTTSPFVQMRSAELNPSTGKVEIRWNATDKNLGPAPVTLFYRTQPDGQWQVVARDLKNDGVHQWAFPRENSAQFFFKVEVADQAGNVSNDVTRQALAIDVTEPRAVVVGVTGSGAARP